MIYFDRTAPMLLTTEASFDGIEVDVPEGAALFAHDMGGLLKAMQVEIEDSGAPEDSNQALADMYVIGIAALLEKHNGS